MNDALDPQSQPTMGGPSADEDAPAARVPGAPRETLATGEAMDVQPGNLAAAKDALAARHAAERAAAEQGEGASIDVDSFRSVAPPAPDGASMP